MNEGWGEQKVRIGWEKEARLEEGWRGKRRKKEWYFYWKANLKGKEGGEGEEAGQRLLPQYSDQGSHLHQLAPYKTCKDYACLEYALLICVSKVISPSKVLTFLIIIVTFCSAAFAKSWPRQGWKPRKNFARACWYAGILIFLILILICIGQGLNPWKNLARDYLSCCNRW